MYLSYIDEKHLYYGFLSGAREVIKNKKNLNKINVFPVADGDTGTNLAITMNGMIRNARLGSSIKGTLESIADAALHGARGNSGTIFAQYINGITMELKDDKPLTIDCFATTVKQAVHYAYEAIEKPIEGTIITVIKDWADAVNYFTNDSKDYIEVLSQSLTEAEKSLIKTPDQLQVLKDKGVVDSGGKGFVLFLQGFLQYLVNGKEELDIEEEMDVEFIHAHTDEQIHYRYCTEALIEGVEIDLNGVRASMKEFGDSIIVAGNNKKAKIHIHTNDPEKLFSKLKDFGTITSPKAEDMIMQNEIVTNRKYRIALVTDSIADIPKTLVDHYQIYQLPLELHIGSNTFLDKVTIKSPDFYRFIDGNKEEVSSSQPSGKNIESLYSYLSTYYDSIIVITVSKEMSGTHFAFKKVADNYKESHQKITVINSKVNSGAEGLVVLKAAEAIHQGLEHNDVVKEIEKTIEKSKIFVSVDTLEGMVRQGRISNTVGTIGKFINLKPIVSIDKDGKGILIGKAFSIKKNTEEIYKLVKEIKEKNGIERYAIVHGKGEKRLKEFESRLIEIIGEKPVYIDEVSSIVAMSAGENTLAVALLTN